VRFMSLPSLRGHLSRKSGKEKRKKKKKKPKKGSQASRVTEPKSEWGVKPARKCSREGGRKFSKQRKGEMGTKVELYSTELRALAFLQPGGSAPHICIVGGEVHDGPRREGVLGKAGNRRKGRGGRRPYLMKGRHNYRRRTGGKGKEQRGLDHFVPQVKLHLRRLGAGRGHLKLVLISGGIQGRGGVGPCWSVSVKRTSIHIGRQKRITEL